MCTAKLRIEGTARSEGKTAHYSGRKLGGRGCVHEHCVEGYTAHGVVESAVDIQLQRSLAIGAGGRRGESFCAPSTPGGRSRAQEKGSLALESNCVLDWSSSFRVERRCQRSETRVGLRAAPARDGSKDSSGRLGVGSVGVASGVSSYTGRTPAVLVPVCQRQVVVGARESNLRFVSVRQLRPPASKLISLRSIRSTESRLKADSQRLCSRPLLPTSAHAHTRSADQPRLARISTPAAASHVRA
jgi:hypothetical protein